MPQHYLARLKQQKKQQLLSSEFDDGSVFLVDENDHYFMKSVNNLHESASAETLSDNSSSSFSSREDSEDFDNYDEYEEKNNITNSIIEGTILSTSAAPSIIIPTSLHRIRDQEEKTIAFSFPPIH